MSNARRENGTQAALGKSKSDLIAEVAARTKLPVMRVDLLVNQVFDHMVEVLQRGERIEIRGFGSFTIRLYSEYVGRNPRSGQTIHIKAKRLPFFKVGKELQERINAINSVGARGDALKST